MDIQDSAMYREILTIQSMGANPVHFNYRAQIHANGKTIDAMKVIEVDYIGDYEVQYCDTIHAKLVFTQGTFYNDIFPYQDALECTIIKEPLSESGGVVDLSQPTQTERYKAILSQSKGSPLLEQTGNNDDTKTTLDIKDMEPITIQLIDRAVYQMRMVEAGGNFRNVTPERALRAIMTMESQKIQVDNQRAVLGVDIVPTNNQTARATVTIPDGIPIAHIPQYVHQKCGGLYSAGMGYYFRNGIWYIYPCYDPTRSKSNSAQLTILNVPKNRFPGTERTYRQDGGNIVLMATGDVKFRDNANVSQLNRGNGVRFADVAKLFEKAVTTKNNIVIASRGALNTEAVTAPRPDGLNMARTSPRRLNANPFLEFSETAKRNGSMMALTWENADSSLLVPGMLATVIYQQNDALMTLPGVLLKTHTFVQMQGSGMTDQRHITNTALSVFVQRPVGNNNGVVQASAATPT